VGLGRSPQCRSRRLSLSQQHDRDLSAGLVGVLLIQREDPHHLRPEGLSFDWGCQAGPAGEASGSRLDPDVGVGLQVLEPVGVLISAAFGGDEDEVVLRRAVDQARSRSAATAMAVLLRCVAYEQVARTSVWNGATAPISTYSLMRSKCLVRRVVPIERTPVHPGACTRVVLRQNFAWGHRQSRQWG
jgi:hypothetical protein